MIYQWNGGIDTWDILKVLFLIFGTPVLVVMVAGLVTAVLMRSFLAWGAAVGMGIGLLSVVGNLVLAWFLLGALAPVAHFPLYSPVSLIVPWSVVPPWPELPERRSSSALEATTQ